MAYQKREKVTNELVVQSQKAVANLAKKSQKYLEEQLPNAVINDLVQDVRMSIAQSVGMSKGATVAECRPESILACMINAYRCGVSLNPTQRQAYLVPYRNGDHYIAQFSLSYMGMVDMIYRDSGIKIRSEVVYSNEPLEYYSDGFDQIYKHTFLPEDERGDLMYAFSMAKLPDGEIMYERMTKSEIEKCRKASKGSDSEYSPWQVYTSEMWRKSVIRRHCKNLPNLSNVVAEALANDESLAIGRSQDLSQAYEDAGITVETPQQPQRNEEETMSAFDNLFPEEAIDTQAVEVNEQEGE